MELRKNLQRKLLVTEPKDKLTDEIFDLGRFVKTVVYIVFALGIVAGFVLIEGAYERIWLKENLSYTKIMQQSPIYFWGGLGIIGGIFARLDFHANIRLIIMVSMFGAGFVGGHVFWT